ncbi:MAG: hypothetical protein ACRDCE_08695, partial [Cetobacterium sp.]|uniref:hypothetical protein n=1 Tax=Cetobacterium sp. TaxID=2071632 RepID=UPI003EE5532A
MSPEEWYKKGYWFHKPGYYYRHVDALRGEYLAFGTYPGCTRSTDSKLLVELLKEGYKPITE